jgi:ABC-2 type transport system ATP-binding protein
MLADRIAIVDKGKIVVMGSPQDLIAQHGGLKVLVIRKADKGIADTLQKEYDQVTLSQGGDVLVKIDNVDEMWKVMNTLTDMKIKNDIDVQTPTIEDVFLKIVGGRITEEGELKQ